MSLYGNIKRIGSSTFQFDRVYSTRDEMDKACAADGVYAGRYVLVEYGERYTNDVSYIEVPSSEEFDAQQIYYTKNNNNEYVRANITAFVDGITYFTLVSNLTETDEYKNNRETDLLAYGNVYDSTVWQKIYTNYTPVQTSDGITRTYGEKYIMVAELNALVPQLSLIPEENATLIPDSNLTSETELSGLFYGNENKKLHKVKEIKNIEPHFDMTRDTELNYLLHMPKPMELKVDDDIHFHEKKFDIYHTYSSGDLDGSENRGKNFIGWKPVLDHGVDSNNNLTERVDFSQYSLNMYLPAFGDILGLLYDTLFGTGSNGELRPFFRNRGIEPNENTDYSDVANVQDVFNDLLSNNSEGLAGILSLLFSDRSVPGETKFWVAADWLAKNMQNNSNTPGIINKPKVVLSGNDKSITSAYNGQYQIEFYNWELATIFKQMITSIIKTAASLAVNGAKDSTEINGTTINYDYNKNMAEQNQEKAIITYRSDTHKVQIKCENEDLINYYYRQDDDESHCWVGIQIDSADSNDTTISIEFVENSDLQTEVLENNQYIIWVPLDKMDNVANTKFTMTSQQPGVDDIEVSVELENNNIIAASNTKINDSNLYTVTYASSTSNPQYSGSLDSGIPTNGQYTIKSIDNIAEVTTATMAGLLSENSYTLNNGAKTSVATNYGITNGNKTLQKVYTLEDYTINSNSYDVGSVILVQNNTTLTPNWSMITSFSYQLPQCEIEENIYTDQDQTVLFNSNILDNDYTNNIIHKTLKTRYTADKTNWQNEPWSLNSFTSLNITNDTTAIYMNYSSPSYNSTQEIFPNKNNLGYSDDETSANFLPKDLIGWTDNSETYTINNVIPANETDEYYAEWQDWNKIIYRAIQIQDINNETSSTTVEKIQPYKAGVSYFPVISNFEYTKITNGETFDIPINKNGGINANDDPVVVTVGMATPQFLTGWRYDENTTYSVNSLISNTLESNNVNNTVLLQAIYEDGIPENEEGITQVSIPDLESYYYDTHVTSEYTYSISRSSDVPNSFLAQLSSACSSITYDGSNMPTIADTCSEIKYCNGFQLDGTNIILDHNLDNVMQYQTVFDDIVLNDTNSFTALYSNTIIAHSTSSNGKVSVSRIRHLNGSPVPYGSMGTSPTPTATTITPATAAPTYLITCYRKSSTYQDFIYKIKLEPTATFHHAEGSQTSGGTTLYTYYYSISYNPFQIEFPDYNAETETLYFTIGTQ